MKVGILGGGQLARMLALAAHRLDLDLLVLDPKPGCSAAAVAPTICADYEDPEALARLGRCDLVTYEFENVPAAAVRRLGQSVRIVPDPEILVETGDRLLEKRLLRRFGFPTPRFRPVDSEAGLRRAVEEIGLPAVLKTRRLGYDGRGQRRLCAPADLARAWRELGPQPLILEELVDFDREVSLIAVRSHDGSIRHWDPTENRHVDGILRVSRAPARGVAHGSLHCARGWVDAMLTDLRYVGVLAVEFFVRGDEWMANETACRVHNSGHWTAEGAATSQFENHLRAIAGLPLGSTRCVEPSAMVNLIGEVAGAGSVLSVPGARLHLYGKSPAPGRKLGHVTLTGPTSGDLEASLELLARRAGDPVLQEALGAERIA